MIARGEFSIIIAGLGAGIAGAEGLAALATAYVFIMAVGGPIASKLGDPGRRRDRSPTLVGEPLIPFET